MWIRIPLLTQNNHFITVEVIYVSNAFDDDKNACSNC